MILFLLSEMHQIAVRDCITYIHELFEGGTIHACPWMYCTPYLAVVFQIWLVSLLKRDFAEQENPLPHVSLNRGRAPILLFDDPFFEELDDLPVPRERRLPPLFAVNAPRRMQWLPSRAGTLAVASGGVIELWGLADKLEECRKNYKTWRAPDDGYKVVDPTQVLNLGAHVHCLVSSGEYLVTGDAAGCVQVWDVAKGMCTQQFRDHKGAVTGLFGVSLVVHIYLAVLLPIVALYSYV